MRSRSPLFMKPDLVLAAQLPWQQPNATEFTAAKAIAAAHDPLLTQSFFPFPWATWIDRCRHGAVLESPTADLLPSGIRATVCQHIWALDHLELFQRAGITDLFWSHTTQGLTQIGGIRIHPFPLYPVRCATHPPTAPLLPPSQRPLLYSFQGAYAPGPYLTPVRDWLLELPPRPDAQLERRQEWHYEQAVYRPQVQGEAADAARHAQLSQEADAYAATLQRSCFALCPSGSGPNSIRLWEALGYGAIPVILSEQLQLPGSAAMWQAAAVVVPETQAAVAALPAQLEALAADPQRLLAMQEAGKALWRRYGLDGFVGDVVELLRDPLAVLRERALRRLPPEEPVEIQASSPVELPLLLLRSLRQQPQPRSVLIQINDTGPRELLRLRWQAALRLSEQQLIGRPSALSSVVPELEEVFGREARQVPMQNLREYKQETRHSLPWQTRETSDQGKHKKQTANKPIVFIYQPGKVGSSTVYATLLHYLPPEDIVQLHFLSEDFKKRVKGNPKFKWHVDQIMKAEKLRDENPKLRIKIICLVRDPISRNISDLFQNPQNYLADGQELEGSSIGQMLEIYQRSNSYDYILNWFDREFARYTGIDVYNHAFDQLSGYSIFRDNGYDVLILRMEDLDRSLGIALTEFLGIDASSLQSANRASSRRTSPLYEQFREKISFSKQELEEVYCSKYAKHFYESDREKLMQKWSNSGRRSLM